MAAKICSNCGENNSENALLCIQCGSSLKNSSVVGTPDAQKNYAAPKKRVCSHCNETLEADDTRCRYCGTVYTKKSIKSDYSTSYSYESSFGCASVLLYIGTFFIPLVGLIVGGIFALNDDPEKQSIGKGLLIFGLIMLVVNAVFYTFVI